MILCWKIFKTRIRKNIRKNQKEFSVEISFILGLMKCLDKDKLLKLYLTPKKVKEKLTPSLIKNFEQLS